LLRITDGLRPCAGRDIGETWRRAFEDKWHAGRRPDFRETVIRFGMHWKDERAI
jgi:hypothetical protein